MNRLDKQNLINILKPFKDKIDNLSSGGNTDLDEFKSEVATQLNNKLSLTGGALMGPLSIINDKTNIVLSAQEKSARLAIGSNYLDLTDEGKLKVNDKSVLMDGDVVSSSGNTEVKLPDDLIKITNTTTSPSTTVTTSKNTYTEYATMPYNYISGAGACKIGDDIFLFGGADYTTTAYKFNVSTKQFTKLPNIPVVMYGGSCSVAVNGIIYLIGGGTSYLDNYKFDKTTNTYTKIAKMPTTAAANTVSRTINGECIYICGLGSGDQDDFKQIYQYSVAQGTFSKVTDKVPYDFQGANMYAHNSTLELFALGDDANYHYAFDLSTKTFTKKNNIPFDFKNGRLTAYGGNVYLFNTSLANNFFYKYDYATDTYTKMTDMPHKFNGGSVANITSASEPIYLFGGNSSYSNKVYTVTRDQISSTTTIPGTTTTSTYTAMLKPSGHSIYTASKSYTSSSAQLVAINSSDYYTEYDENNNVIKNTSAISSTGTTKLYVKSGGKLHGKALPSSTGWQTIDLLKYI